MTALRLSVCLFLPYRKAIHTRKRRCKTLPKINERIANEIRRGAITSYWNRSWIIFRFIIIKTYSLAKHKETYWIVIGRIKVIDIGLSAFRYWRLIEMEKITRGWNQISSLAILLKWKCKGKSFICPYSSLHHSTDETAVNIVDEVLWRISAIWKVLSGQPQWFNVG